MSLLIIACLGFFLIAAILYSLMGGGTLCIFLVLVAIVIAVLFALNNDDTPPGEHRSFINKIKPYHCSWCAKSFWSSKGALTHEKVAHPMQYQNRQETIYAANSYRRTQERLRNAKLPPSGIDPNNYLKPCTWCGASGWRHGVRCDWCGGSGKLPR